MVRGQLVKTLVIEYRHQLCVGWFAILILDGEPPLFLLSGLQAVAEGLPLELQSLFWSRTVDYSLMTIGDTILHPCESECQTIGILFLIGELPVP